MTSSAEFPRSWLGSRRRAGCWPAWASALTSLACLGLLEPASSRRVRISLMPGWNRRYRVLDDGERIEGTWRHVFTENGATCFLADLKVHADGLIDCWGSLAG